MGFPRTRITKKFLRAFVEGDLFRSARSSFFSCLKMKISVGKSEVLGRPREKRERGEFKKTEGNPSLLSALAGVTVFDLILSNNERSATL